MKVLVVDDSALMRKYLRQMLEKEGDIEVIVARDGEDALEKLMRLHPDVVTLDINMPVMDGLTCLSHIMKEQPTPVVMLSSLTEKGAVATFEALDLGAVDFIAKPDGTVSRNIGMIEDAIIAKVRGAAGVPTGKSKGLRQRLRNKRERAEADLQQEQKRARKPSSALPKVVLIGVSTGGPKTLEQLLPNIPANFPLPIVIAQHMPESFTGVFANRMNGLCKIQVEEVHGRTVLRPGLAVVGRGGADITLRKVGRDVVVRPVPSSSSYLWHPSVSRMVASSLTVFAADEVICVQLTGMGDDGAKEMTDIYQQGGHTIAESEESAIIFGMPERLIAQGGAEEVLPIEQIAEKLIQWQ